MAIVGLFWLLIFGAIGFVAYRIVPWPILRKVLQVAGLFVIGILLAVLLRTLLKDNELTTPRWVLLFFLFFGLAALFVWGLVRFFGSHSPRMAAFLCPPTNVLKDLLAERLPPAEQVRLATHLEWCKLCQHRVEKLTASQQAWPGMASKLSHKSPAPDPALRKVMARLKDVPEEEATRDEPAFAGDLPLGFLTPTDKPGQLGKLERYEVLEEIGRGGMGVVLKAFDPSLHRIVAIKVLAPQLATSGAARKRFLREAKAAAAVTHDHIVTIHAVDEANGLPYLVMQYIAGQSLQDRIDKDGPLELSEILRIGMQTASGLAAAHGHGIIHRDIKPGNILLEEGVGRVKLTDFGLARAKDDASLTQSGFVAGSPLYMAPEQARGESLDPRADLFSLGSVLYTMCTGRPPFRAANTLAVLRRVCEDTPRPIREINPDIPDWLADIVNKLLAKDAAERYQTAADVMDVLGQQLAQLQHTPWVPPARSPAPPPVEPGLPTSLTICPSCGANLHVPEKMVGSVVHCEECGKPFQVEQGSEEIHVARAVPPPFGPKPRARRRIPRWIWIPPVGCAGLILFILFLAFVSYRKAESYHEAMAMRAATTGGGASGTGGGTTKPVAPQEPFWKTTLTWLPAEPTLFGAARTTGNKPLRLDDEWTQSVLHLFTAGKAHPKLTEENLGRLQIERLAFAYYDDPKPEKSAAVVYLHGSALDGHKRVVQYLREATGDKIQVEKLNQPRMDPPMQSLLVSGSEMPFALGVYDDNNLFLGASGDKNAKEAQHLQALKRLPWVKYAANSVSPTGGDLLTGYNPPWVRNALYLNIPHDACAFLLGEVPASVRQELTESMKLRVCPRTFVFYVQRSNNGYSLFLTLYVDKAGAASWVKEDLEQWCKSAPRLLNTRFPATHKEHKAADLLGSAVKILKFEVKGDSVKTNIWIPDANWDAFARLLKSLNQQ